MEAFPITHDPHYKPQPFRTNLFQPSNPSRISTDPETTTATSSSTNKKSHLHGLHHHHRKDPYKHKNKHNHEQKHSRHEGGVQSAVQLHPPTSFGDLLKQASRSKNTSPTRGGREGAKGSTGGNANGGANGRGEQAGLDGQVESDLRPKVEVRPEDVSRERAKTQAQEEALRTTLQSLSDASLKTSRKLDDTYYSILEKLTVLRQTIGSLQELSSLTKDLHNNFLSDTNELTEDIRSQFKGFNDFAEQEEHIGELTGRIDVGRKRAEELNERLAKARRRVEARAKAEAEWEKRTNRRLQVLWGILGTIACVMILAILFQHLRPSHNTKYMRDDVKFASQSDLAGAPIAEDTKEAILNPLVPRASGRVAPLPSHSAGVDDDAILRKFDEL